jgi:hypothetical protein
MAQERIRLNNHVAYGQECAASFSCSLVMQDDDHVQ